MVQIIVVEREFTVADQKKFAALSGDRNPLHMDAVAARRAMTGLPVVHGMHVILWAIDKFFESVPDAPSLTGISIRFGKMVHVGDRVQLIIFRSDRPRLEVRIDGMVMATAVITFGTLVSNDELDVNGPLFAPNQPLKLTFEQAAATCGHISLVGSVRAMIAETFPAAVAGLGIDRTVWLARSSFLVGMVCPGLHSIYGGLDLDLVGSGTEDSEVLNFKAIDSDLRFRLIRFSVSGAGWRGTLEAFAGAAPVAQPVFSDIASRVAPNEFGGGSALVIGGSRGLGEVIAKIMAAGGAHVTVTYAIGEADARRVQAEISASMGRCDVLPYDARLSAGLQLRDLRVIPDQLYYLATPPIFRRKTAGFAQNRFDDFLSIYVSGFYDICHELRSKAWLVSVFYPSSISVETRPANMTEYTMAKAAGEILCADMQQFGNFGPILVRRLPRLSTDQTVTLSPVNSADPVDVMLPIVREVHARRQRSTPMV